MRKEFSTDMVCDGQSVADYLGKFENSQSKFALSYGQKLMVTVISDSCRELVHKSKNVVPVTSASVNSSDSVVSTRPTTSDSQEASMETKEKLINRLFNSLRSWLDQKVTLAQVDLMQLNTYETIVTSSNCILRFTSMN